MIILVLRLPGSQGPIVSEGSAKPLARGKGRNMRSPRLVSTAGGTEGGGPGETPPCRRLPPIGFGLRRAPHSKCLATFVPTAITSLVILSTRQVYNPGARREPLATVDAPVTRSELREELKAL